VRVHGCILTDEVAVAIPVNLVCTSVAIGVEDIGLVVRPEGVVISVVIARLGLGTTAFGEFGILLELSAVHVLQHSEVGLVAGSDDWTSVPSISDWSSSCERSIRYNKKSAKHHRERLLCFGACCSVCEAASDEGAVDVQTSYFISSLPLYNLTGRIESADASLC
jgi:hypothetical protein